MQEVRGGESGKDCEYGLMEMRGECRGERRRIVYSGMDYGEIERSESDKCWKLNRRVEKWKGGGLAFQLE